MSISERTSKIVWGECAARCCICQRDVLHNADGKVASLVGEVAHIVGETATAARGASDLPPEERSDSSNLLLLCREHHKIVDDAPEKYSVEDLLKIKEEHLDWIATSLVKPRAWRSNISQLTYINVPRLCEQAELHGLAVDLRHYKEEQTLHSLGWELNHVMSSFRAVLARLSLDAIPLQNAILHESLIGMPVAFDRQRFRTRNVPMDLNGTAASCKFSGDLAKDPHIYAQLDAVRVVLYIDSRWITTSTAFTLFRPSSGQTNFSGLGRVTSVDYELGIVTVTPWVIGLPQGRFERALQPAPTNSAERSAGHAALDSSVDLKRARLDDVHFYPPPTDCELCRKSLADEKYMIDGAVRGARGWACMCGACFLERGEKIGWGHGQLYLREKEGWLEVAGFPPPSDGNW